MRRKERREQMKRLVRNWRSSNLSQKDYCLSIGMNINTFQYWVARERKKTRKKENVSEQSAFLPVTPLKISKVQRPEFFTIRYPNGVEVQIASSADEEILQRLIQLI